MNTPAILPTYNRTPFAFEKGKGSWLYTAEGEKYLDLGAGIAVNALGHAPDVLVDVLHKQAQKLWHVSNLYRIPEQETLAQMLIEKTFADHVFFTNSGTEAAELAIKMVRKYWHDKGQPERIEIIAFDGAFHGRSSGAIAAAGSHKLTQGFGPLLPGFRQVEWNDIQALKAAISSKTAAVIVEPIQGEGGIRPLSDEYLKTLRALCDETGALLIFDEVQCGMGRSGKLFVHEWAGITPDIMMIAKGIGGGFPLGALLSTKEASFAMTAGSHGSTYGGNPLACAIGCKVLEIVSAPEFLSDVSRKAALFRQGLESLVATHPKVFKAVRGQGLILGLVCQLPNTDVIRAGYDHKILSVIASDNVIRLLPALNISDDDISEALTRLDRVALQLEKDIPQ